MNATLKKKLCWNCEGRVGLEEQNCPFCAVYLGPAPNDAGERKDDILAPPYKIVDSHENESSLATPYAVNESRSEQVVHIPTDITGGNDIRKIAIPLTLLSGGLVFLLFGFILYLFSSNNGVLTLQWNGSYWYLYLVIAAPLLAYGWRMLQQIDKSEAN